MHCLPPNMEQIGAHKRLLMMTCGYLFMPELCSFSPVCGQVGGLFRS